MGSTLEDILVVFIVNYLLFIIIVLSMIYWLLILILSTLSVYVYIFMITDPILRDSIKYAVVARAEELRKFHEVPRLGVEGHKFALKYVYKYMRCCENFE